MKFKSPVYSQASRSIGGLTYSHNRGGMYTRARATPTNPNTPFQQAVKAAMASVSSAWSNVLTDAEREAWDIYAAQVLLPDTLGENRNVGGIGMFNRTNVFRVTNGFARIDVAPVIFDTGTYTPLSMDNEVPGSPSTIDLTFTPADEWASTLGGRAWIYGSRPQNPGINFFKGPFRFCGEIIGAAVPPTSPETVTLPFDMATGQIVFVQYRIQQADGRTSTPVILRSLPF